jgi:hypothetical protein
VTDIPTPQQLDQARHEFASVLLTMAQQLAPLFDAADGIRADMAARGWSPTAAEQAALTWLQGMLAKATGSEQR